MEDLDRLIAGCMIFRRYAPAAKAEVVSEAVLVVYLPREPRVGERDRERLKELGWGEDRRYGRNDWAWA